MQSPGSAAGGALVGCLLSLPDPSLQGYSHLAAWVLPSLPHLLEDPCCLENPAPQATSGPDGMCLLTELQDLSSCPLSPISLKHAPGQWLLLFLLGTQAAPATDLLMFFPFAAPGIKSVFPRPYSFQESERHPYLSTSSNQPTLL